MLITAIVLSILGLVALVFGAWGRFSESGQKLYDEMAGMIPFFSYYLGILLLAVGFVFWVVILYRLFSQPGD